MRLYRIVPKKYLEDFSGKGKSYKEGARWNRSGEPVLYFGTSAAVAMLEMENYIPKPQFVPKSYVLGVYETSSTAITTLELGDMPQGWDDYPYPPDTQFLGSHFLSQNQSFIHCVPSSATGGLDYIAVLNPLHPDITSLKLVDTKTQIYNPRLFIGMTK